MSSSPRPVSYYAREIRAELGPDAFAPARSRLVWLPIHLAVIAVSIVVIAMGIGGWPVAALLSLVIGSAFAGLTFLGHETLHGAIVRGKKLRHVIGWIGFLPFTLSPRLWLAWHNRVHHGHTMDARVDPDAYPSLAQYRASRWVRMVVDGFAPGRGRLCGVFTLLLGFTVQSTHVLVASRAKGHLSKGAHRLAVLETALGLCLWTVLGLAVGLVPFVFAFVVPLLVANVIVMSHILTNHSLSPLTEVNDPLMNSLTVTTPRWVELATLSFGLHVEHHLFPAMSSRHAKCVRDILRRRWPELYQSMPLGRALTRLFRTGRVYKEPTTLYDPNTGREWSTLGLG